MGSSGRQEPSPGSGTSGSGSISTPSSHDDSNEAGDSGLTGIDAPQFEWVYNSDHTDPVNFGFMFLKPVGTRPSLANAGPSHIPVRPRLTNPATSFHPPPHTESMRQTTPGVAPPAWNVYGRASKSSTPESAASDATSPSAQVHSGLSPPGSRPHFTSPQSPIQRSLDMSYPETDYRSSMSYGNPLNAPDQPSPISEQWYFKLTLPTTLKYT